MFVNSRKSRFSCSALSPKRCAGKSTIAVSLRKLILVYHVIGSATAIGEGLFKARSELAGNPSGNNRKVWLFTDGKNNAGRDPGGEADLLKGMGGK